MVGNGRLLSGLSQGNVIALVLVVTTMIAMISTQKAEVVDATDYAYDCKKIAWRIAKKVLSQFRQCSLEMKAAIPDDKERSKYVQCSVKCTLTKMKLVNNVTERISEQDADAFLANIIKPQFWEVGKIIIGGCLEDFDAVPDEILKEPFCNPYGDLLKCMQDQLGLVC